MNWITVITSAVVGAAVSSLVSLLGQHLERRARRRELLLAKAIDLAVHRTELVSNVALKTGAGFELWDSALLAGEYFSVLEHLLDQGALPEAYAGHYKKQADEIRSVLRKAASRPPHE